MGTDPTGRGGTGIDAAPETTAPDTMDRLWGGLPARTNLKAASTT
jgi:hypothetical protein